MCVHCFVSGVNIIFKTTPKTTSGGWNNNQNRFMIKVLGDRMEATIADLVLQTILTPV